MHMPNMPTWSCCTAARRRVQNPSPPAGSKRKVTQITFKPNWSKHPKAAPFRRKDDMLSVMPSGLIVFPGNGITDNLADKARRLGIPIWQARKRCVSAGS